MPVHSTQDNGVTYKAVNMRLKEQNMYARVDGFRSSNMLQG